MGSENLKDFEYYRFKGDASSARWDDIYIWLQAKMEWSEPRASSEARRILELSPHDRRWYLDAIALHRLRYPNRPN